MDREIDEKHELSVQSEGRRFVKRDPDQNYSPGMTSFERSSEELIKNLKGDNDKEDLGKDISHDSERQPESTG